ncbi:MAG TPA: hypothetical protein VMF31_06550 [Solirubrobacterales bacterium]|nr:hypothetical protein [Solirubrobacterales bacterium]
MVVVGIALLAGITVWFLTGCNRDGKDVAMPGGALSDARIVSSEEIASIPDDVEHEVFWAGERPDTELELSDDPSGNVHLRYLTGGSEAGTAAQTYLDIGTYPFKGAYQTTRQLAQQDSLNKVSVDGGVGFYDRKRPYSVILAFSDQPDLQIEVYHPEKNGALDVVRSGDIVPVP